MYDHIASSYNALHGAEQQRKLRALLARVMLPKGAVLDVGCATAHLSSFFSDREYVGVDPSQPLLDLAPAGVRVLCARGEQLPFSDSAFPVVLSLTALHNYSDFRRGVEELFRVCGDVCLVGVLKKAPASHEIVSLLKQRFSVQEELSDQHDFLLVLRKV